MKTLTIPYTAIANGKPTLVCNILASAGAAIPTEIMEKSRVNMIVLIPQRPTLEMTEIVSLKSGYVPLFCIFAVTFEVRFLPLLTYQISECIDDPTS